MSDLLKATVSSPLLLTFLVVLGGFVWAVEKLGGVNGPISRAVHAWQERELRRLERERRLILRRRELRDARVADLESEVAYLRAQLDEQHLDDEFEPVPARDVHPLPRPRRPDPTTTPIPTARNSARARPPAL